MSITITALDPSQKDTLEAIIHDEANPVSIIYGPPGTGKSHLIVSLLFDLALSGKKILFASQNSEALQVVTRKCADIHTAFGLRDEDLSFLDFCLCLNSAGQRHNKYISSQYSRIKDKILQSTIPDETDEKDETPYALTYTQLDAYLNRTDSPDTIGIDELLYNNLHNVHQKNIISQIMVAMSKQDIRQALAALNSFNDKYHLFAKLNQPTNQLRLLSRHNSALNLHTIQTTTKSVVSAARDIVSTGFYAVSDMPVEDYLTNYSIIDAYNKYLRIAKLRDDDIALPTLISDFRTIISQRESIKDVPALSGLDNLSEPILANDYDHFIYAAKNIESLDNLLDIIQTTHQYAQELLQDYHINSDIILNDIFGALFHKLEIQDLAERYPAIKKFMYDELRELIDYLENYKTSSALRRIFKSAPALLPNISNDDLAYLCKDKNLQLLGRLAAILKDTEYNVNALYDLSQRKGTQSHSAINAIAKIDAAEYDTLMRTCIELMGLEYDDLLSLTLDQLVAHTEEQISAIKLILKLAKTHTSLFSHTKDFIKLINTTIENNQIISNAQALVDKYKKYLQQNESTYTISEVVALHDKYPDIEAALSSFRDIAPIQDIRPEAISELLNAIIASQQSEFFSQDYYTVKKGENLNNWRERIAMLLSYKDMDELDCFIKQNTFIDSLAELLGADNKKILEAYLDNSELSFEEFKEYLVNDLVNMAYSSMSYSSRLKIPDGYFKKYRDSLFASRRNYYLDGLKKLRLQCFEPARDLANYRNWRSANTYMEKIRLNTSIISKAFPIIIATPAEVAKYVSPQKELFDYVVFDEASQLLPGQALPSIYRAKKAIIVGDPHQMPPSLTTAFDYNNNKQQQILDDSDSIENETSILDLAIRLQLDSSYHLKTHYRSESNQLFEPSRKAIYDKDGIKPIFEAQTTEMPIYVEENLGSNDDNNFSVIVRRIEHYLLQNEHATFCILFTRKFQSGLKEFREYLEKTNNQQVLELYEKERILISTVTDCQGIEGDHSIIYLPYYDSPRSMWFFKKSAGAYKRLNVAVTRQKKTLDIIMANPKSAWLNTCQGIIDNSSSEADQIVSAQLLNTLLTYAGQQIDEDYLERILGPNCTNIDSPLTEQLYNMLVQHYQDKIGDTIKIWCEVGWNMVIPDHSALAKDRRNVGFRVDIGIYSPAKKKFILGIEMDGSTYHSGFSKEFSDMQRQEILELKGWNIYRIWSTNWLNNPEKEFNRLIDTIDEELSRTD